MTRLFQFLDAKVSDICEFTSGEGIMALADVYIVSCLEDFAEATIAVQLAN